MTAKPLSNVENDNTDGLSSRRPYLALLRRWADGLLALQYPASGRWPGLNGGLLCPLCSIQHGRGHEAAYPLLLLADHDQNDRYRDAAMALFAWSAHVSYADGSYVNDPVGHEWRGITVFAAIGLAEALTHHSHTLTHLQREQWRDRLRAACRYIAARDDWHQTNINYPISAAAALASAGTLLGREDWLARARDLLEPCLSQIATGGLLRGEGGRGMADGAAGGIDLVYNLDESLAHLALFARITGDDALESRVVAWTRAHLTFMLPDGGLDNSWGSRQAKWTYYGGRTTGGCQPVLMMLAGHDPAFAAAADRNLRLMNACTDDGLLYGGPHVFGAGRPPCVQHTFTHMTGLALALDRGRWQVAGSPAKLPREIAVGVTHDPDAGALLVAKGPWRATFAAGCAGNAGTPDGPPSGGALSMLWHAALGPLFTAGMTVYWPVEPMNMAAVRDEAVMCPTPRVEAVIGTTCYSTLYDRAATIDWEETRDGLAIRVAAKLLDAAGGAGPDGVTVVEATYLFTETEVTLDVRRTRGELAARLVMPLIAAGHEHVVAGPAGILTILKSAGVLRLQCDPAAGLSLSTAGRHFSPVPGFQCLSVQIDVHAPVRIRLSFDKTQPS